MTSGENEVKLEEHLQKYFWNDHCVIFQLFFCRRSVERNGNWWGCCKSFEEREFVK